MLTQSLRMLCSSRPTVQHAEAEADAEASSVAGAEAEAGAQIRQHKSPQAAKLSGTLI